MTEEATRFFTLASGILIFWLGCVAMSIGGIVIDQLLGIEISGSRWAKVGHSILGMAKGGFLIWLMSVTVLRSLQ